MKKVLLFIFILHLAGGCKGTETGNPGNPGGPGTPTSCPASLRATTLAQAAASTASEGLPTGSDATLDELILRICQKIIGCGVATTNDTCANALNGEDGDRMIDELGFTGGTTILQLRQALLAGTLVANDAALVTCEADLSAVDCGQMTPVVTGTDFSQVETFIPASCSAVYSSPEASGTDGGTDC